MDPTYLQLFWLLVVVVVPAWCIVTKRHGLLLIWICVTFCLGMVANRMFVTLTAPRVAGLLLLPFLISNIRTVLRANAGKWLFVSWLLMAVLGLLYGFISPWPDPTGVRLFNQTAEGRSIIYVVRSLADISLAIFIAAQVAVGKDVLRVMRYLLIGTSIAAFGVILELITRLDIYFMLTAYRPLGIEYRLRGFNEEPRFVALYLVVGILLLFILDTRLSKKWWFFLLILHGGALLWTTSTTGILLLIAGIIIMLVRREGITKRVLVTASICVLCGFLFITFSSNNRLQQYWQYNLQIRLQPTIDFADRSLVEKTADSLEVFEGSALNFFLANPAYLFAGTGPGLVSLPASDYIPTRFTSVYGNRIDTPPHMGILLELSNGGIIGLLIWIALVFSCHRAVTWITKTRANEGWELARSTFLLFSLLYLLQADETWFAFLGLGLAASIQLKNSELAVRAERLKLIRGRLYS